MSNFKSWFYDQDFENQLDCLTNLSWDSKFDWWQQSKQGIPWIVFPVKTFYDSIVSPLNNVPTWIVSPSGDALKCNVPGRYLRKYGTMYHSTWDLLIFRKSNFFSKLDSEKSIVKSFIPPFLHSWIVNRYRSRILNYELSTIFCNI